MDNLAFNCLSYFFTALAMLISLCNSELLGATGKDTLSVGASLRANQTIISKNGIFELGFFNPNGSNNWYVGIWYAQISDKTIVWVANRESPVREAPGILMLSTDGNLTVFNLGGAQIWSTNDSPQGKASRAVLLDSGNFVLLSAKNSSEIVWESFRHPTDTFLPTMKFWKGMKLTSWKSWVDPAAGPFILEMNPAPEQTNFLQHYKNGVSYYNTGSWMGSYYTTTPDTISSSLFGHEVVELSPERIYYKYWLTPQGSSMIIRQVMNYDGYYLFFQLIDKSRWTMILPRPQLKCGVYGACGAYGVCFSTGDTELCSCMQGFHPADDQAWNSRQWWLSGCVRRNQLSCSDAINGSGSGNARATTDEFLQVTNISLSDEEAPQYAHESTLQGCKSVCLNNCSCLAFALTHSYPAVCKLWFGNLLSMQEASSEGEAFFVRLAASDFQQLQSRSRRSRSNKEIALFISTPLCIAILGILFLGIQRRRGRALQKVENDDIPRLLRTFTSKELGIATDNFAHELGKGAFGSVFRGTLPDNSLVAVKKLQGSAQGEKQFRAEISTIGNINHVNLVRLRGFCVEGSERMLVYEYMQNGSLNFFLTQKFRAAGKVLDWNTRFKIALGIARGLLYLHEECRDRIIHCDIKPENVLLDAGFCPKVADFGLAKLVGRDFSEVLTTMRGTRGYLAPEWISGMPITVKADVYSFGMTLLEIISGRRNLDLSAEESQCYFPTWAATQIQRGNFIDIVDERIAHEADVEQIRRAVMVSILSIEENETLRPSMAQVVLMLQGKSEVGVEQFQRSLQAVMIQGY